MHLAIVPPGRHWVDAGKTPFEIERVSGTTGRTITNDGDDGRVASDRRGSFLPLDLDRLRENRRVKHLAVAPHVTRPEPEPVATRPRYGVVDLLALANTRHGPAGHWFARPRSDTPDHDHLNSPAEAIAWLRDHQVALPDGAPSTRNLADLRAIRDMVRDLPSAPADPWTPAVRALMARAEFRLAPEGEIGARAEGWDGFVMDLLPPLLELVPLRLRVRRCQNPLCRFTFVDHSRAQNRMWCDPRGCGNRIRVRRQRQRMRETSDSA